MTGLRWWMRGVAVLYLFLFIAAALLRLPIKTEGPKGVLEAAATGDATARFVVDTWVAIGLFFAVMGAALLIASRSPDRAGVLAWTVIGIELFWGMTIDIYKIGRGYDRRAPVSWMVIHGVVIMTGLLALGVI